MSPEEEELLKAEKAARNHGYLYGYKLAPWFPQGLPDKIVVPNKHKAYQTPWFEGMLEGFHDRIVKLQKEGQNQ